MNVRKILACLAVSALLVASTTAPAVAGAGTKVTGTPVSVESTPENAAKAEAVARKVFESGNPEFAAKALGADEVKLFEAYNTVTNVISSPKNYSPADSLARQFTLKGITPAEFGTLASGCWNTGQREFKLGVGGWDVSSPRPCVRLIGYGNGGTGADLSCNPW